jgi:hypothetical protein
MLERLIAGGLCCARATFIPLLACTAEALWPYKHQSNCKKSCLRGVVSCKHTHQMRSAHLIIKRLLRWCYIELPLRLRLQCVQVGPLPQRGESSGPDFGGKPATAHALQACLSCQVQLLQPQLVSHCCSLHLYMCWQLGCHCCFDPSMGALLSLLMSDMRCHWHTMM